jgi:hypothetical protein
LKNTVPRAEASKRLLAKYSNIAEFSALFAVEVAEKPEGIKALLEIGFECVLQNDSVIIAEETKMSPDALIANHKKGGGVSQK